MDNLGAQIARLIEQDEKRLVTFIQCLPFVTENGFTIEDDSVIFQSEPGMYLKDDNDLMNLAELIGLTPLVTARDSKVILKIF